MPRSLAWPKVEAAPMSIFLFDGGATALALVTGLAGTFVEDVEVVFLVGSTTVLVMPDDL